MCVRVCVCVCVRVCVTQSKKTVNGLLIGDSTSIHFPLKPMLIVRQSMQNNYSLLIKKVYT